VQPSGHRGQQPGKSNNIVAAISQDLDLLGRTVGRAPEDTLAHRILVGAVERGQAVPCQSLDQPAGRRLDNIGRGAMLKKQVEHLTRQRPAER
jgi:hypothetical protein